MIGSLLSLLLVTTPVTPTPSAEESRTAEASDEREELVCRRRLVPSERVGERFRVRRDCRTREEWDEIRQRRGG